MVGFYLGTINDSTTDATENEEAGGGGSPRSSFGMATLPLLYGKLICESWESESWESSELRGVKGSKIRYGAWIT